MYHLSYVRVGGSSNRFVVDSNIDCTAFTRTHAHLRQIIKKHQNKLSTTRCHCLFYVFHQYSEALQIYCTKWMSHHSNITFSCQTENLLSSVYKKKKIKKNHNNEQTPNSFSSDLSFVNRTQLSD